MEMIATSGKPQIQGCSSSRCGTSDDGLSGMPESVRKQVENHPCFSEKAHHHFARMHVAVAPACNIQCNYCNRKYDCSNESRPGVVSEVLTPDQAVRKIKAVAASIPQMTVLGIAGPGDPLANPERTFSTFRRLAAETPDIKLCVSTNGLRLPEFADEIAKYNIQHVTITINCLDPEIGAKIYPWIYWNNRRIRGVKAAKILLRNQLKGLEMLVERGVLVKINSVMIPGVNDQHLKEVSRVVKEKGAFLHNVMPLIAEAEHGTFYGLTGQASPTGRELRELQDSCSDSMSMMRHCRQCRADAVGMLGEDRGQEFTLDKLESQEIDYPAAMLTRKKVHDGIMALLAAERSDSAAADCGSIKPPALTSRTQTPTSEGPTLLIGVASKGQNLVNQHFGHATEFLIYRVGPDRIEAVGPRRVDLYCGGANDCPEEDAEHSRLQGHLAALADCKAVLCAKIGFGPWQQLEQQGIAPSGEYAFEPIESALRAFYQQLLTQGKPLQTSAALPLRNQVVA
tara:strand:+ start:266 stop:1801 length:1536 start_codon:yes stop_codon:yes gene_type:complete